MPMKAQIEMSKSLRRNWRRSNRCRGIALVWAALLMLMLVAFLGIAIDLAYGFVVANELQNAADAAALAGADEAPFDSTQAVTDATNTAAANSAAGSKVTLAASDVVVGNYNSQTATFTAAGTPTNAVQVTARRTSTSPNGSLGLLFGPIFGVNTVDVSRKSIATNDMLGAAILILNQTASPAIQLTGTGASSDKALVTNGGAVVVDSGSSTAIQWTGHPYISAAVLDIHGNDTAVPGSGVYPSGSLSLQAPIVPDPLASLSPPTQGTNQGGLKTQPPGGWPAGYYPNGLPAGTLAGGIYYVDGGISLKGNQTLDASAGAMIYLHTGGISMKGTSTLVINPLTTGPYAGISFYEDRSNSSAVTLQGTSGQTSTGTLYFPKAQVTIAGNPNSFGNQLIADTLVVQGNGQLNINYDGRNPTYRHEAYLVK
jgi:Flp pilus assembly protein TadG